MWPCVQLLCAECNVPCQWNLAINKAQPPASDRSSMLNHKTLPTSDPLSYLLGIEDLDYTSSAFVISGRLPWYGHVERSNGAAKTAFDIQIVGKRGPGRPKMTWKHLTERDCREWKLSAIGPHDRDTWRSGVSSKPVTRKGAHCCGYCPCTWRLIKNRMMMMMIKHCYNE